MLSFTPSLLAGLVVWLNVANAAQQEPLLLDTRNVSVDLFAELEELARVVDISYCVGSTSPGISSPFRCLSRCAEFPDFDLVTTWNTGALLSDSCGYIALDHGKGRIIVAFRGTYSVANTIVDLSTIPQEYIPYPDSEDGEEGESDILERGLPTRDVKSKCENCTVHSGFHKAWVNTRDRMMPELRALLLQHPLYQLHLVGHSLGGAVAALAGLDFRARGWNPIVTTFGEPRIGNAALVHFFDDAFDLIQPLEDDTQAKYRRVTHVDDPVPLLPLSEWGYDMHAGEIFISKSSLSPDIGDLEHCRGDNDQMCIAGQDSTTSDEQEESPQMRKRDLIESVKDEIHDVTREPWGIPARYKLWQLFFAHRDYFWRLGLCLPSTMPLDGMQEFETEAG